MHHPVEKGSRAGSAATDKLAPSRCASWSETRQCPRSGTEIVYGEVSSGALRCERLRSRLSLHQLPNCEKPRGWWNKAQYVAQDYFCDSDVVCLRRSTISASGTKQTCRRAGPDVRS